MKMSQLEKLGKYNSRKLGLVILGLLATIIFPDAWEGISLLVGVYCGSNTAQKFTSVQKSYTQLISDGKDLAKEVEGGLLPDNKVDEKTNKD